MTDKEGRKAKRMGGDDVFNNLVSTASNEDNTRKNKSQPGWNSTLNVIILCKKKEKKLLKLNNMCNSKEQNEDYLIKSHKENLSRLNSSRKGNCDSLGREPQ